MGQIKKQLSKAVKQNNYGLVLQLLQAKFDKSLLNYIDKYNSTYLINAISFCSLNIVDLLLKKGADVNLVNHTGDSALCTAIENYYIVDKLEKVKLLLTYNTKPEIIKYALHLAASSYETSSIVKLLIDYDLDLNFENEHGDTPLIKASLNKTGEQSVIYLVEAGANINLSNNFNINFSHGIFAYEHQVALKFLKQEQINLANLFDKSFVCAKQESNLSKDTAIKKTLLNLEGLSKLIIFFSLSAKKQLAILPNIGKKTKFDCGGDFYTDRALMVLTLEYDRCLNNFMLFEDEYIEQKYRAIYYVKQLICNWIKAQDIDRDKSWNDSVLLESRWMLIRKLSQLLKDYLQIGNNVNRDSLEKIIIDSLHP